MPVNVPVTIWRPTNGNGEAVSVGVSGLVDLTASTLVDLTGSPLVSTGTDFTLVPQTIWTQDDSR